MSYLQVVVLWCLRRTFWIVAALVEAADLDNDNEASGLCAISVALGATVIVVGPIAAFMLPQTREFLFWWVIGGAAAVYYFLGASLELALWQMFRTTLFPIVICSDY